MFIHFTPATLIIADGTPHPFIAMDKILVYKLV